MNYTNIKGCFSTTLHIMSLSKVFIITLPQVDSFHLLPAIRSRNFFGGRENVCLNYTLAHNYTPPKDVKQSSNLEAGVNVETVAK